MLKIGYHLSVAGSLDLAIDRAATLSSTAMQIFVSNPRGWEVKFPADHVVDDFVRKKEESGIEVVCHMPYLPNLASTNPETYKKSISALAKNIEICSSLRIPYLITHLGSHLGKGKEQGLRNVINALETAADSARDVSVLMENQAGHANCVGADLSDLLHIYENSSLSRSKRIGFCLDTCHLFAAGYDIRKKEVLDRIDDELGFEKVHSFHMNDAKFPLDSKKDRHENIGKGFIGMDGFRVLLDHSGVREKILIIETPYDTDLPDGSDQAALLRLAGHR